MANSATCREWINKITNSKLKGCLMCQIVVFYIQAKQCLLPASVVFLLDSNFRFEPQSPGMTNTQVINQLIAIKCFFYLYTPSLRFFFFFLKLRQTVGAQFSWVFVRFGLHMLSSNAFLLNVLTSCSLLCVGFHPKAVVSPGLQHPLVQEAEMLLVCHRK